MLRRTFTYAVLLAGLGWLLLLSGARLELGPRPWPIELLDTFALYAFAPFFAVGLAALALRSRALFGLFVVAMLLFWQQYGEYLAPRSALAASEAPTIRVLTYNSLWKNEDVDPLVDLIRDQQPDVVVLQELTSDYADDLQREIKDVYRHQAVTDLGSRGDGAAVFSRLPILEARAFTLSRHGHAFQEITLAVGSSEVSLFNVHLESPRVETTNPPGPVPRIVEGYRSSAGDQELELLIAETASVRGPFILAGDFNIAAGSRPYRGFPADWHDAFKERGSGFGHTFPAHFPIWRGRLNVTVPLVRIDYILSSPEIVPTRAWVPEIDGSDHLPVIADLQIRARRINSS